MLLLKRIKQILWLDRRERLAPALTPRKRHLRFSLLREPAAQAQLRTSQRCRSQGAKEEAGNKEGNEALGAKITVPFAIPPMLMELLV